MDHRFFLPFAGPFLALGGPAEAVNLVPNPGFES